MGFLIRDDTPLNMNKAVISLWFKIPEATWTAAASDWTAATGALPDPSVRVTNDVLTGIIPLMTWGPQQTDQYYHIEGPITLCEAYTNDFEGLPTIYQHSIGYVIHDPTTAPSQPSFIGIRGGGPNAGSLVVHLQCGSSAVATLWNDRITACDFPDAPTTARLVQTTTDASYTVDSNNDYFGNSSQTSSASDGIPDGKQQPLIGSGSTSWHHVLISWDVTDGSAIHNTADNTLTIEQVTDAYSKLWCALDDSNRDGENLPAMWLGMHGTNTPVDPNAMLSSTCTGYAFDNAAEDSGTISLASPSIPSNPMSIPGPATLSRDSGSLTPVYKVEMADLQIFTDRSLDMSEANRRLFVSSTGAPVSPSISAAFLGKSPEVLFRGSGFISGTNLGTAGDFTPTGTIVPYGTPPNL